MAIDSVKLKIIQTIFLLEGKKGHLKWTVNQLAVAGKISRSLVYYHFGKTKKDVLINSLELIGAEFYALTPGRQALASRSLADSLELSHIMYKQNPDYAVFYQKWRHKPSPFRDVYLRLECAYDLKLKKSFPKATASERLAIQAVFHGVVTAPYLNRESIESALGLLELQRLS